VLTEGFPAENLEARTRKLPRLNPGTGRVGGSFFKIIAGKVGMSTEAKLKLELGFIVSLMVCAIGAGLFAYGG